MLPRFQFCYGFWQVDGNWGPGYKNLTLNWQTGYPHNTGLNTWAYFMFSPREKERKKERNAISTAIMN